MNLLKKICLPVAVLMLTSASIFGQQTLGLNAQRTYDITPADFGLVFDTIRIVTDDGANLFGWHLYPGEKQDKASKKSVIISCDGNGNMANGLEQAGKFLGLGFHVFIYDYRGFGKSSDFNVSPKFYIYQQFAADLQGAIDYVKKYHPLFTIDLYGWGIGGGLSLGLGANNPKVHRVIADNPYTSFETVQKRYEEKGGGKIFMPIGYNVTLLEPKMALIDKGENLRAILLIIGENGNIMNVADMQELQLLKKKITTIYTVKGVDNDKNFSSNRDEYFKQVKAFFEANPE